MKDILAKLKKEDLFEKEIGRILKVMEDSELTSVEYRNALSTLERMMKMKNESSKNKKSVSPDTLAVVCGNLAGIIMILSYEKTNTITSKAINFILRGRV